ncbi:hypothetical protein DTL42_10825 [Bremerella cremea]|uniref:Uncharacterized protein n=1 Tax=Bremerella cremea TaxID=1031537 RepID=A0A368KS60_9BACT|nr:hypothetical protein DTL42_10825 [Bremerella cremea]
MEPNENPFASPVEVSRSEHRIFQAHQREVVAKEIFQATIAAILSILLGLLTVAFVAFASLLSGGGAVIVLVIMLLMTLSCIATTINHWHRANRAKECFPLVIDEGGVQAKFEDGGTWNLRTIPWNQITNIRFAPRDRMVVTTTTGSESIADLRLLGGGRWKPLKATLAFYSDWMAPESD